MSPHWFCCALALCAIAGCSADQHCHGGQLIVEHTSRENAAQSKAPYKATYALYRWRNPPPGTVPESWVAEEEVDQLVVRGLTRWDKVGFERGDKGQLFAVAGEERIPLEDGRYCWHITRETEYRGVARVLHETGDNLSSLLGPPVVLVCSVMMLPAMFVALALRSWF